MVLTSVHLRYRSKNSKNILIFSVAKIFLKVRSNFGSRNLEKSQQISLKGINNNAIFFTNIQSYLQQISS